MTVPDAPALSTLHSAHDVQEVAEAICRAEHGGWCIAWGQARVLRWHCQAAIAALNAADLLDVP